MSALAPHLANFQILIRITSSLSIFGSFVIIVTYMTMKEFQTKSNRLVFYMSVYDLIGNIGTSIGDTGYKLGGELTTICQVQGLLIHAGLLGGIIFAGAMAVNLLIKIKYRNLTAEFEKRLEYAYNFVALIVAVIPGIVFAFYRSSTGVQVYGNATLWCWVTANWQEFRLFFFGPIWFTFVFNMIVYVYVGIKVSATAKDSSIQSGSSATESKKANQILTSYISHTSTYILGMLLTWVWGSMNRIQNMVDPKNPIPFMFYMHATFTPAQGFINFVIYAAYSPQLKRFWKKRVISSHTSSAHGETVSGKHHENQDSEK